MQLEVKLCATCYQFKPVNHFYHHHNMKDGYMKNCKGCHNKRSMERYKKTKPKTSLYPSKLFAKLLPHLSRMMKDNPEDYKKPESCLFCGNSPPLKMFIPDLSNLRSVTWLCVECVEKLPKYH